MKILIILGPTASGKSSLALNLARHIDMEIISGDSAQVYRGLDIGTAKPTKEELKLLPHHLIDIRDPKETYSVADFQMDARTKIKEIETKGKLPVIVGGTALYIKALLYNYPLSTDAGANQDLRQKLRDRLEREGNLSLHTELKEIDPQAATKIHSNDSKRIIRALEVYYSTGKLFSSMRENTPAEPVYDFMKIGLHWERNLLYQRINNRVEEMIEAGFLKEVQNLLTNGYDLELPALQALGYKELGSYLKGDIATLEEAIELIKRNTRRFAKRQLSWFRADKDIHWLYPEQSSEKQMIANVLTFLEGKWLTHGEYR